MPQRKNNPGNQFVKKVDPQPWNRSKIEVEPSQDANPEASPGGRYNDRIRIPAMDEQGAATPRSIKQWPEGLKRA